MPVIKTLAGYLAALIWFSSLPLALASDLARPINDAELRPQLERSAALHLIRVAFDVETIEELPALIAEDAEALAAADTAPAKIAELSEALTAEGSYYITSLRYLIGVGGANWPTDRPAEEYDAEALSELADIQHQWLVALTGTDDIRPLLLAIDQINGQTEGYADLPPEFDHFSGLDQLVDTAIEVLKGKPAAT